MTFQLLVVTMNKKDCDLINKIKIDSDAIITNQTDREDDIIINNNGNEIRFVSTKTKGVGVNRNLGLSLSTADILLFCDDDVILTDNYKNIVLNEFENNPKSDVILFGREAYKNGELIDTICEKKKSVPKFKLLKYPTPCIAVKRKSIIENNISFSTLFGGGCIYSHGEDSLFLLECHRKKLKISSKDVILLKTSSDNSTCFYGYTDEYFYNKGAWLKCAFPKLGFLLKYRYAFKFSRLSKVPSFRIIKLIKKGMKGYKTLSPYKE